MEFSEYIEAQAEDEYTITDYSFQWMDKDGKQLCRWDNTPHFPHLDNAPHHIHRSATEVVQGQPVDIFSVLDEMEPLLQS